MVMNILQTFIKLASDDEFEYRIQVPFSSVSSGATRLLYDAITSELGYPTDSSYINRIGNVWNMYLSPRQCETIIRNIKNAGNVAFPGDREELHAIAALIQEQMSSQDNEWQTRSLQNAKTTDVMFEHPLDDFAVIQDALEEQGFPGHKFVAKQQELRSQAFRLARQKFGDKIDYSTLVAQKFQIEQSLPMLAWFEFRPKESLSIHGLAIFRDGTHKWNIAG